MKIVDERKVPGGDIVEASAISVGTIFEGRVGDAEESIDTYWRIPNAITSIYCPSEYCGWAGRKTPPTIYDYSGPLSATLTIHGKATEA